MNTILVESSLMSTKLLVFAMTGFASKTLVYLAAALIPLQPLAVLSCGCGSHGQHGVDANTCQEQAKVETGCCGRGDGCRCSSHSPTGSCCTKTHRAPAKSCCNTEGTCSCRADDSSEPVPQVPPQSRGNSVHDVDRPLAIASFSSDDHPRREGFLATDRLSGDSGFERCIVLCRFRL